MYGIILTGHGKFAEGLISSVELILGKQKYVESVEFAESHSPEILMNTIKEKLELMKETDGIIFLTDLQGGTPFNVCVMISQKLDNSKVLAGTNLPLLIEVLMNRKLEKIQDILDIGISTGKNSIIIYENKDNKGIDNSRKSGI